MNRNVLISEVEEVVMGDTADTTTYSTDTSAAKLVNQLVKHKQLGSPIDNNLLEETFNDIDINSQVPKIALEKRFAYKIKNKKLDADNWSEKIETALLPMLFSLGYPDLIQSIMEPLTALGQSIPAESGSELLDLAIPNHNVECVKLIIHYAGQPLKDMMKTRNEEFVQAANIFGNRDMVTYLASLRV